MGKDFLEKCQIFCSAFYYPLPVKIINAVSIEKIKVESRINEYTHKIQYHAGTILNCGKKFVPKDAYAMICILHDDLYPRDSWNFVFGLASLSDRIGVFSFARYNPVFFGEDPPKDLDDIILYRACKVMSHELGHQFGIKHCVFYSCAMNGSNHLEEASSRPIYECPVCLRKLHLAIGFDVVERYTELAKACDKLGGYFKEASEWYKNRIKSIEEKLIVLKK